MNLLKRFTQNLDRHKLTDAALIAIIVILAVIFKLHKANYFNQF